MNERLSGCVRGERLESDKVKSKLKGGHLGSWMATKDASLNAAENDFPIEI